MNRLVLATMCFALAGCGGEDATPENTPNGADASGSATASSPASTPTQVTSFANVDDDGNILGVGVVVPVTFFEDVPTDEPAFDTSVGLEMPASVRDKTFVQLLRINWLAGGHGPEPYHAPHFDLHFYRGSKAEVSGITCPEPEPFPAELLADGYETPSTCVNGMGYHAWPSTDVNGGAFTGSIILGYAAQKMVFIEPMITQELLVSRQSFDLDITRPLSAGSEQTLFPAHFAATYAADTDTYRFEFQQFAPID